MTDAELQDFKRIINQKQMKFEWGVAEPVAKTQNNEATQSANNQQQATTGTTQQAASKGKTNSNMINFKDLPVKQSEIISSQKQRQIHYSKKIEINSSSNSAFFPENNEHFQRLNMLKNQFQILKGIMVDSKIFEEGKSKEKLNQNLSKSNLGSIGQSKHTKIGEIVRGKDKLNRKQKISSSSISDRDINLKYNHLKQKDNIIDPSVRGQNKQSYNTENNEKDYISNSRISNKRSEHHSQNMRSRHGSRISENRQHSPRVSGMMSVNLLEKHSLQLQLRNSLQKIQVLLQNQIILKRKNNELQQKIREFQNSDTNKKQDSKLIFKIQELNRKLVQSQQRVQSYKNQNREIIHRLSKMQADLLANQSIMQLLKQQKNQQINNAMQMKLSYANLQIQNKRILMERQIDKRNLQYEIERLKKDKQRFKELGEQNLVYVTAIKQEVGTVNLQKDLIKSQYQMQRETDKQKIKRLQAELYERQRRYKQSLADLEKKNLLKQQAELLQLMQVLHKKKIQGQGQGELKKQLNRLKEQIIKVKKEVDLTQSQFGFQSKVISLQQALVKDSQQKERHLLQMQKFQKQFEDLKQKYRLCQQELEDQTKKYIRTINELKQNLLELEDYKPKYEYAEKQIQHLGSKNEEMQRIIRKYEDMQGQITHLRETLNKKQTNHNMEIRDARRRVDQAEFQSFKVQQQSKLNLDLNTRRLNSNIEVLHGKLQALENDRNYYREQYGMLRQQNQFLALKLKDIEFQRQNLIKIESQMDLQQKQRVKRQHQNEISALNARFVEEQKKLIEEISVLTNINQEQSQKLKRLGFLQVQNDELRLLCKNKITADASVLHLWEIKEVEYNNVNQVLKYIKNSQKDIKFLETSFIPQTKNVIFSSQVGQPTVLYPNTGLIQPTSRIIMSQNNPVQYIAQRPIPPQIISKPVLIPQGYAVQQQARPQIIQQINQIQNSQGQISLIPLSTVPKDYVIEKVGQSPQINPQIISNKKGETP